MSDIPTKPEERPLLRVSRADLESVLATLDVDFVKLAECVVAPGWRLTLPASDASALHYNLTGTGQMLIDGHPPVPLRPHTLVIVPPDRRFSIEAPIGELPVTRTVTIDSRSPSSALSTLRRRVAGEDEPPQIIMICGYFRALYGVSINLFGAPTSVIVEQFDPCHQLDHWLKLAMEELIAQEIGMSIMATTLLKQVLVTLLRRALCSANLWVERFPIARDPQIARAFADMAARPSHSHTVLSLSQTAGLSRSAFMARFTALLGKSPMIVLRDLRMRRAAALLRASDLSLDRIIHEVGYASRSGFARAFQRVYGELPQNSLSDDTGET